MPRLMEKSDWMKTVADVGTAEHVWYENIVGVTRDVAFSLPETGHYRVILVKLSDGTSGETKCVRSAMSHDVKGRDDDDSGEGVPDVVHSLRGLLRRVGNKTDRELLNEALAEKYGVSL